jgi:type IV secretion system protein VirB4
MIFKEFRSKESGLSDLLNFAHFVEEGIILNKDGALMCAYLFKGPDINSATTGELDSLTANLNNMFLRLDDGWMVHVDEIRVPAIEYSEQGFFKNEIARLIDEERRVQYEAHGNHFENMQIITFVWKFPVPIVKVSKQWFVEGLEETQSESLSSLVLRFKEKINQCAALMRTLFSLKRLDNNDFLSFLNTCITGKLIPVHAPPQECYLDVVLGRENVIGGYVPVIGSKKMVALTIIGYLNRETAPGLLEYISTYPMVYRWSNRFIVLGDSTAEKEISRYKKDWSNKVIGFVGFIKEALCKMPTAENKKDENAILKVDETKAASLMNQSGMSRFGYWTSTIILMDEEYARLEDAKNTLEAYLNQRGFTCVQESVNAFDAWIGSIPGHGSSNMRRLIIHSMNLAQILPLHTLWTGARFSHKASLLPKNSPPIFYASTTGKTPFRFHSDVSDLGHMTILGPSGAGKSTLLDFIIAQFFRYENAQVFVFDKDYSHLGLTAALDGVHYDIEQSDKPLFCPLADLATEAKKLRAKQFIEDLVVLQNVSIIPDISSAISDAVELLSQSKQSQSLTVFQSQIQHQEVRGALKFYSIDGQMKLLDGLVDSLKQSELQTFEMGWLLKQRPNIYLPILRYIFDQIESRLDEANGKRPTLIILEEAWLYIAHPFFAEKLIDWLKTLRKKNARVIFATQSLFDLYDPTTKTLTKITAAVMESCPTKIYLPNSGMEAETENLYRLIGLNDRKIEIIGKESLQKRDYYVTTPEGDRLIELGLTSDSLALQFIGMPKEPALKLIQYKEKYGKEWGVHYLFDAGLTEWSRYLKGRLRGVA